MCLKKRKCRPPEEGCEGPSLAERMTLLGQQIAHLRSLPKADWPSAAKRITPQSFRRSIELFCIKPFVLYSQSSLFSRQARCVATVAVSLFVQDEWGAEEDLRWLLCTEVVRCDLCLLRSCLSFQQVYELYVRFCCSSTERHQSIANDMEPNWLKIRKQLTLTSIKVANWRLWVVTRLLMNCLFWMSNCFWYSVKGYSSVLQSLAILSQRLSLTRVDGKWNWQCLSLFF